MQRNGRPSLKFIHYCNSVSPHQLPLARELVKRLGVENYCYVATNRLSAGRMACGWSEAREPWISYGKYGKNAALDTELENCEVLLTGIRELGLFEKRKINGLKTFYMSERWFKPIRIVRLFGLPDCSIGGRVRMFIPAYRRMAKRLVKWVTNDSNGRVLPIGPLAKKDMLRLGVPESKIVPWGYFVAPSDQKSNHHYRPLSSASTLKVLWVGRMIPCKRVDTIIRALRAVKAKVEGERCDVQLTLVGDGSEKSRLQRLANQALRQSNNQAIINFLPSQPIDKIRSIMCAHDVFVFASNGRDGWGAVVSEALEEGLKVIGTFETGASAAMLADNDLFHAGDWRALSEKLAICLQQKMAGELRGQGIGEWSAEKAADRLMVGDGAN